MSALNLDAPSRRPFVVVILDKAAPPQLRHLAEAPERFIELDGERFSDAGLGDWIGFYDWLRCQARAEIGIRLWPDTGDERLSSLQHCRGVEFLHEGKEVRIFFGDEREFHPWLSCDQDFGANRFFVGASRYAMSFNAPCPQTEPPAPLIRGLEPRVATGQELLWRLGGGFVLLAAMLAVAAWTR